MTPEQALTRLFTADRPSADWFDPSFLAAVPVSKVETTTKQVRAANGSYKGAHAKDGHWIVEFERGTLRADVALDGEGRFTGLFIRPDEVKTATLEEALADFRALPGKVSVLVSSDGTERGSIEPEAALAVGSTFKLATLAALRAEIDRKKRSWKDVLELRPEAKSLPSGLLQEWPDHAPVTLYTLAALMISRSDNTATDTLLGLLGRDAIEPFAPRNKPYLTPREISLRPHEEGSRLATHGDQPRGREAACGTPEHVELEPRLDNDLRASSRIRCHNPSLFGTPHASRICASHCLRKSARARASYPWSITLSTRRAVPARMHRDPP